MFGALAKTYYAEKIGVKPENVYCVSIMPCTAKKLEAGREEMSVNEGIPDVDAVLTTREAAQMMREAGVDFVEPARRGVRRAAGHLHRRCGHLRRDRRRYGSCSSNRI